jgi:hypothetical protein
VIPVAPRQIKISFGFSHSSISRGSGPHSNFDIRLGAGRAEVLGEQSPSPS